MVLMGTDTLVAVHPRAGGEHSARFSKSSRLWTPVHPRAGGEHREQTDSIAGIPLDRFIPAQAGNTATTSP